MRSPCPAAIAAMATISLAACSDDATTPADPDAGPASGALFAVMFEVYDDSGSTSYLSLFDAIDGAIIDPGTSREYAGGRAFLQTYNGWIFVGDPATPTVTRYSIGADGALHEDARLSLANYGLPNGSLDTWNVSFISPTKAYLFDFLQGTTIVWDPSAMAIRGDIPASPELARTGLSLEGSPGAVRGNRLYRTFNFVDYDTAEYSTDVLLGVYDLDADQLVSLTSDTRCPALGNLVHRDEQDRLYFSNWIWSVAGVLMHGAPRNCALRIDAGADGFDPDWSFRYADIADGREGGMFTYVGADTALFAVFYDERITFDATTDPWSYAGSQNWRLWSSDLAGGAAAPIEGIDFNAGAFTPVRLDGRSFAMVPSSDWSRTTVFELAGGRGEARVEIPGWSYQMVQVR